MKLITITAPAAIAASGKIPTFEILAYTGGPLRLAEFELPVIVDLASLKAPRQNSPVLRDHLLDRVVGHTTAIRVGISTITAAGLISATGEHAAEVVAMAKRGFPWQASIGANPERLQRIEAGQTVVVNGQRFQGPVLVAQGAELKEISFVALGADGNTAVSVAARSKEGTMSFEEWLASLGLADLSPEKKAELKKAFDALNVAVDAPPANASASAERLRIAAIDRVFSNTAYANLPSAELQTIKASAIAGGLSPEDAEERLRACSLAALRANRTQGPGSTIPTGRGSHQALTADHLAAAIMVRAGYAKAAENHFGAVVLEQSKRFHRASLPDLCAAGLQIDGHDAPQGRDSMIRAALSGGSIPIALNNSAGKILLVAYTGAPAPWRSFATTKSCKDFKEQTGLRPTFLGELEELPAGGALKHGSVGEETYTWSVDTYAKQLQIDRRDFINDDLGIFGEVLPSFGKAAARSLNNLVATVILANASSFWGAGNGNYFSGAATNLQASSLATAIQMMRQMQDAEDNFLDLEPRVLLVPPELEVTARELLESTEVQRYVANGTDRAPMGNALRATATLAIEPRLSSSDYTGYSTTAWWLFSAPENAAVVVGFLDGMEAPHLENFGLDADINHLSYGWRVYHDFGVALGDYRASIKSKGAA